jgi:hypothetical protein
LFKRGTRWATDNITISCFVWDKRVTGQSIIVRPKSKILGFYKNPEQAITPQQALSIVSQIAQDY